MGLGPKHYYQFSVNLIELINIDLIKEYSLFRKLKDLGQALDSHLKPLYFIRFSHTDKCNKNGIVHYIF